MIKLKIQNKTRYCTSTASFLQRKQEINSTKGDAYVKNRIREKVRNRTWCVKYE